MEWGRSSSASLGEISLACRSNSPQAEIADSSSVANSVLFARVAQLDRALASGAKGCGFDPRRETRDVIIARLAKAAWDRAYSLGR